ncbi:MAG: 1,2-phenylacetyl-CoA epoxidase subunit PaaD [Burkholderiaceae bacterium]
MVDTVLPGRTTARASLAEVTRTIGQIPDPEIPVVTLADLGILRSVELAGESIVVTLTPTYSGCPATESIADDVNAALRALGHADAQVLITLSPAWSTDWMLPGTHEKLRAYGIAPPGQCGGPSGKTIQFHPLPDQLEPVCPRCSSPRVESLSEFGSTPCKALYRCLSCAEPFDYFKPF